jgi:exodeoxyribonuclease V alpha subunit
LIQYTLPAAGWDPTQELQVVSPMRKAAAGSAALCTRLGPLFNPGQQHRVLHRTTSFSPGDRVLQTENDYVRGVFNGDLGVVTAVSPGTGTGARVKSITVDFSNRDSGSAAAQAQQIQTYVGDELAQLVPAWAVTVHKAQGCEFPVVAVVLSAAHGIALQRNSLYTAASRASQLLVVISSKRALMQALANKHQGVRHSHLGQRLLLAAARRTGAKRHYHAAAARRDADEYPPF